VSIVENGRRISGIVRGIDAGGALMLATEAGVERIVAGEVSVEGAYS
jgi:biotin-(acetyl-CoA carboxylase) ligase